MSPFSRKFLITGYVSISVLLHDCIISTSSEFSVSLPGLVCALACDSVLSVPNVFRANEIDLASAVSVEHPPH